MLSVSCRWYVTDQFWNRGSVRPSGVDGDDVPTDIDCGIDERRKLDSVRGEARVQVMCGEDAVGVVRRERADANPCVGAPP